MAELNHRDQEAAPGRCEEEGVILLPLFPQELAIVQKALRALLIFGDERDIRMNIEDAIRRCHRYPDTPLSVRLIEMQAFDKD